MKDLPSPPSRATPRHRLLVVDDDQDCADSICEFIGLSSDWEAAAACGTEQAISSAQQNPPDVVLMEVEMQGQDGFAFATRLAQNRQGKTPVMLSLTGNGKLCDEASMDRRFADSLMKPVDTSTLLEILATLDAPH